MTDLELIYAANKAGLCVAQCWDLDELYKIGAVEDTEKWIRDSRTEDERDEKQRVANYIRLRAQEKMNNLRAFAELILASERSKKCQ
jgi:hypothetical protein